MEIMNQKESDEQAQEEVIKKAMERFGALIREDFKRIETSRTPRPGRTSRS